MELLEFDITQPVQYNNTGKFEALSPGWKHQDFVRTDFELFVVTEDTLYVSYAGKKYAVSSGQFLLLPPVPEPNNHIQGYQSSGCAFYWLHFTDQQGFASLNLPETEAAAYIDTLDSSHIVLPSVAILPAPEKIVVLMRQLQDSVKDHYHPATLNYMTTTILCEVFSQYHHALTASASPSRKSQKQMYSDIIDYIKLNVYRSLRVSDVARHFGYNEKYISHLFSEIAGMPLKQYILMNKMDAANFMLTDTNESILDIALSLGFPDGQSFSKTYKRIRGLTPSEYRNAFFKRVVNHE